MNETDEMMDMFMSFVVEKAIDDVLSGLDIAPPSEAEMKTGLWVAAGFLLPKGRFEFFLVSGYNLGDEVFLAEVVMSDD